MKIVYHHRTQGKGVEGVHIREIVNALIELGHNVTIISPPDCDPMKEDKKDKTEYSRNNRLRIIWDVISKKCPQIIFECLELFYNFYAYFQLYKCRSADVIYERYFLFSLASCLISRRHNIPLVFEVNDSSFIGERVRPLQLRFIAQFMERSVLRRSDLVFTISHYFKEKMIQYGVDKEKIIVIPNAINPKSFQINTRYVAANSLNQDTNNKVILGFVGKFVPWHGLEFLMQAFRSVKEIHPNVRLLLVGDGPVRGKIEKLINTFELIDDITITGILPHRDVPAWINKMDIAIIPDSNLYGSPMKLFEYMAAGKTVVAPAYDPIKEIIIDGQNGILFAPRDLIDFVRVISLMTKNKPLREKIGSQAKQDVFLKYTWLNNAKKIESEIYKILSGNSAR